MDDLTQKISELLSSPEGMQKLQAAAASLGVLKEDDKAEPQHVPAAKQSADEIGYSSQDELQAIKKLMPLVNGIRRDDQDIMLLKAIRPYLQDDRRTRLDETIKIMHMLKVLPLLKDKGNL